MFGSNGRRSAIRIPQSGLAVQTSFGSSHSSQSRVQIYLDFFYSFIRTSDLQETQPEQNLQTAPSVYILKPWKGVVNKVVLQRDILLIMFYVCNQVTTKFLCRWNNRCGLSFFAS
jgi:hypothetical protein